MAGAALPVGARLFAAAFALLAASFYFVPSQSGRNLLLYLTAVLGHAALAERRALAVAFGNGYGAALLAAVAVPAAALGWSTAAPADAYKDLALGAYCIVAVYLGVAWCLDRRPALADALAGLLTAAASVAGLGAVAYWWVSAPAPGALRLEGLWGIDNPVHASVLLLGGTLPVLAQVLDRRRAPVWLAALVVPLCFVVLAGARTAAAAYLLVVTCMAGRRRPRAAPWIVAAALLTVLAAALVLGTDTLSEVWLDRGLSYRDVVWRQVWSAYRACSPAIGCGIATPLSVDVGGVAGERAHSIFLAALYHQGVVGLGVFLASTGWLLYSALGPRSRDGSAREWGWMLVYVMLANVTSGDHILVRGALFWACFWIPMMVVAATAGRESSQ